VLRGGPGVGKTALLEYAMDAASDLQIARVAGVQSEISMDFAAVHQLLVQFQAQLDVLPPPQRQALRVAFGLEEGQPPDRFLVGLAALTVLSGAAGEKPVLCVIDDAHWLDPESAQVLAFAARRLYADRVAMIIAVGEPDTLRAFDQLPAVLIGPLPDAEAAELLRRWRALPCPIRRSPGSRPIPSATRSRWWSSAASSPPGSWPLRLPCPSHCRSAAGSRIASCVRHAACLRTLIRSCCWLQPTCRASAQACGGRRNRRASTRTPPRHRPALARGPLLPLDQRGLAAPAGGLPGLVSSRTANAIANSSKTDRTWPRPARHPLTKASRCRIRAG
jgi:AAA ATPase domain